MKKLFFASILIIISLFMFGCGTVKFDRFSAIGKPYEVIVVTPKAVWEGNLGDSIRKDMEQEVRWVNQPEPLFTLRNIPKEAMNRTLSQHRNLFVVNIDPTADSTTFTIRKNVWSEGQVVVSITARTEQQAADYIGKHIADISTFLSTTEQNRFLAQAKGYGNKVLEKTLTDQFGIRMPIPQGYTIANQLQDYLWVKYEMKLASEGIVFYSFDRPARGQKLDLIAQRNRAVGNIPGPLDGTFMTTDMTFHPESMTVGINGVSWVETRGFWKVENDFMGGPFINYITLDTLTNRYIGIDLYVYSPDAKHPKRNFIRKLEGLMLGVTFAGAEGQE